MNATVSNCILLLQTGNKFHFCFCSPESSVAPDVILCIFGNFPSFEATSTPSHTIQQSKTQSVHTQLLFLRYFFTLGAPEQ